MGGGGSIIFVAVWGAGGGGGYLISPLKFELFGLYTHVEGKALDTGGDSIVSHLFHTQKCGDLFHAEVGSQPPPSASCRLLFRFAICFRCGEAGANGEAEIMKTAGPRTNSRGCERVGRRWERVGRGWERVGRGWVRVGRGWVRVGRGWEKVRRGLGEGWVRVGRGWVRVGRGLGEGWVRVG